MDLCGFEVSEQSRFFLIAGTCVVEGEQMALDTAGTLKEICDQLGIFLIYKSSFDKANRSSKDSYRGPGLAAGLKVLQAVRDTLGLPVLTDVHEDTPLDEVAEVVSVLQTPAFVSPNQLYSKSCGRWFAGQYQKRPVPRALGYDPCGG